MRAPVCAVIAVLTLAPESHAVVIARLTDVRVEEIDATTHGTGVVDVERVVSGPGEAGARTVSREPFRRILHGC